MNIKKPLLVLGAVTGIGLAGLTGLGVVSAATDTSTGSDSGANSLIDRIATKFNLNRSDVAAVFDEEKTAREAERQQKLEDRLTQAVTDGKITEEQKTKILAKLEELKTQMEANRDAMKDKTPQERHDAMKQQRDELQQWAKDNDIPLRYLMFIHGHGHHGFGGPDMDELPVGAPQEN